MRYARWKWRAGKSRDEYAWMAQSGIYCFNHLTRLIHYSMDEEERFLKWYEKYLERTKNGM